ncbi:hypothetical protein SCOR_10580 [Sulfidibacter corallicola]|uniref:Periplasmic heavy metal sensor n=1 Tax=Sulfidibacter corallicola TaxID=2818388 RepID=A0A8A4TFA1_SULCO|nr:hypothetical protein [Sulfidibacter corallicola]QTD48220.1 hypothetical protein J3U87_21760 [Sulfidibacter corallicola]
MLQLVRIVKTVGLAILVSLTFAGAAASAQDNPRVNEIRETLRFIRLAESRKSLDLSDEKLLEVNEILDEFEARQIELRQKQRKLNMRVNIGEGDPNELLDQYMAVKQDLHDNELDMYRKIREKLTPDESLQFFKFYVKFQKKVQRQARELQQGPRRQRPGGRQRFRN